MHRDLSTVPATTYYYSITVERSRYIFFPLNSAPVLCPIESLVRVVLSPPRILRELGSEGG